MPCLLYGLHKASRNLRSTFSSCEHVCLSDTVKEIELPQMNTSPGTGESAPDRRIDLSESESLHVPQVMMAEDGPEDPAMLAAALAAHAAADATAFEKPQVGLRLD